MYRFLWRPAWILSHLLVLALVVAMVNLGLWQLRRLDEKRERNATIEENSTAVPVSLDAAIALVDATDAGAARYRPVEVRGTWDPDREVAIRNRSFDGSPGRWIATPLRPLDGGPAVLVVRGWVPQSVDDTEPPFEAIAPSPGPVDVVGYLQPTQGRGAFGPRDPAEGTLGELARVDVGRFAAQYPSAVAPIWLQLAEQSPPPEGDLPLVVPLPEADEGPHLGYAVQWGIFTLTALVGYPLILRRVARQRAGLEPGGPPAAATPPDPAQEQAATGG